MSKTKQVLGRVYAVLNFIRSLIIVVTFAFIVLLCLYQVIARYFTFINFRMFPWGDEIIRTTSVWVAFMAASLGVREGAHLSIDVVTKRLAKGTVGKLIKLSTNLIVLAVMTLLVYYGAKYTESNIISKLLNVSMSKAWFYAALPVGAAYLFIEYLLILIYGENPFIKREDETDREKAAETQTFIDQIAANQDLDSRKAAKTTKEGAKKC